MKNKLLILLILSVFYSCSSNEQPQSHPDLSKANKIRFDFKTDFDSTNKIIVISRELNDLKSISSVRNIISYDPFTYIYCTSSGSMSFYKDSSLIVTMVSNENAKLLDSFKN